MVKYENIEVPLSGQDGNGMFILSRVSMALKVANVPDEEIEAYRTEATSGNYDHLLQTTMETVNVT